MPRTSRRARLRASRGQPVVYCLQPGCDRMFASGRDLAQHIKDFHQNPKPGKAKNNMGQHVALRCNDNRATASYTRPERDKEIIVIDFLTPTTGHAKCRHCKGPNPIPLTGLCETCDPVLVSIAHERIRKAEEAATREAERLAREAARTANPTVTPQAEMEDLAGDYCHFGFCL